MPTHTNEIFIYNNIIFEDGRPDPAQHPVLIAGTDEDYIYCFAMTSQTKHEVKNSPARNAYNSAIKYAKTLPNINCSINNNIRGLINTTYCFPIPKDEAKFYQRYGFSSQKLTLEVITKWLYQQHEILDKPDANYNKISAALGISDKTFTNAIYKSCQNAVINIPEEVAAQRKYQRELRLYREALEQRKTNPSIIMPNKPRLSKDDQSYLSEYNPRVPTEEEIIGNSPFACLYSLYENMNNGTQGETSTNEDTQKGNNGQSFAASLNNIKDKNQLIELRKMLTEAQPDDNKEDVKSPKRAA